MLAVSLTSAWAWAPPALAAVSASAPPPELHNPHDADRLSNGHTLITDGGHLHGSGFPQGSDSRVIEVDSDGNVVWAFGEGLNFAHNADRLPSGNTLISDTGHDRVIEVDSSGHLVWNSDDVQFSDGSHLNYPNDANWLPGNHLLITDRDNHRVLEVARDGTLIWQFGETAVPGSDASHLDGPHTHRRLQQRPHPGGGLRRIACLGVSPHRAASAAVAP
jgi:hypothetical protein